MVARSRVLEAAPGTFRAWRADRLSTDQTQILLDQASSLPEHFAAAEPTLVDAVSGLSVTDTRRAVAYWRQSVDGPGTELSELEQMECEGCRCRRAWVG